MTAAKLKARIKSQGADVKWRALEIDAWGEPEGKDKDGNVVPAKPLIVKVKTLSMDEYKSWSERLKDGDPGERVLLLMDKVYDEKGQDLLFNSSDKDEYNLLRHEADPLVIGSIVSQIMRWGDKGAARKN